MPAKLPNAIEGKDRISISIERTWSTRFKIACAVYGSKSGNRNIYPSKLVRDFIIEKTQEFEKKLEELQNEED